MRHITIYHNVFMWLAAFLTFFVAARILQFVQYNRRMSRLSMVLKLSAVELSMYGIIIGILLTTFALVSIIVT